MDTEPRTPYEKVAELARRNRGHFLSADAHDVGISAATLSRWRSRGLIDTWRRGHNRLLGVDDSWEAEAAGRLLLAGPRAALARYAAIRVLEGRSTTPRIDIVVPRAISTNVVSADLRSHVRLTDDDIVVVAGLRATCPAFTACDLASIAKLSILQEVSERFMADGRLHLVELRRMVRRFRAVKGAANLRELVELLDPAVIGTRSDFERVFLRIIAGSVIPTPTADLHIRDREDRDRYLDFCWSDVLLVVEIDVHPSHGTTIGRRADGARQNDLVAQGYTVLRFDRHDLDNDPEGVRRTVIDTYTRLRRRS